MRILCTYCGDYFAITAEQLGTRGKCPHCKATIILPKAADSGSLDGELSRPSLWMERWLSLFVALFLHLLFIGILLLIPYQYFAEGDSPEGEEVRIGALNQVTLKNDVESTLELQQTPLNSEDTSVDLFAEPMVSTPTSSLASRQATDQPLLNPLGGESGQLQSPSFFNADQPEQIGLDDFEQLLSQLNRNGLEIVIVFDSTGSMEGEIFEVKDKIERMGTVLFRIVEKTRISVCTYRDDGAKYLVKGIPLTNNLGAIMDFLADVSAGGGGDNPEAVEAGLEWATTQNQYRPKARKVVLLFGDAPPHAADKDMCLRIASEFRRKQNGVVSTVTCHSEQRLPEFVEIAQMGGGEAWLTKNEREIMSQLIVLVFGSKYRDKVLQAFQLLDR